MNPPEILLTVSKIGDLPFCNSANDIPRPPIRISMMFNKFNSVVVVGGVVEDPVVDIKNLESTGAGSVVGEGQQK